MREGMGGIEIGSREGHKDPSSKLRALNPEYENRIRVAKPFHVGGVEVHGEKRPPAPKTEWKKLSKAAFFSLFAHTAIGLGVGEFETMNTQAPDQGSVEVKQKHKTAELLKSWEKESEHSQEIQKELKEEREKTIDDLINVYLDPSSAEYHLDANGNSVGDFYIPPIDDYLLLDGENDILQYASHMPGSLPSLEDLHKKASELEDDRATTYDEGLERILSNGHYVWTGQLEPDLITLRSALFEGKDRFFASPKYENAKYERDTWRVSDQFSSGMINCQSSRMDAMLLKDIYEAKGLDEAPLRGLRAAIWDDHVETGVVTSDGKQKLFTDLELGRPFDEGLESPHTQEEATLLPLEFHLALYLVESGATEEQQERLTNLGYLPETHNRFVANDPRPGAMDLNTFSQQQGEYSSASRENLNNYQEEKIQIVQLATMLTDMGWGKYLASMYVPSATENKGIYFLEIPQWISDPNARTRLINNFEYLNTLGKINALEGARVWGLVHPKEAKDFLKKIELMETSLHGDESVPILFSPKTFALYHTYGGLNMTEYFLSSEVMQRSSEEYVQNLLLHYSNAQDESERITYAQGLASYSSYIHTLETETAVPQAWKNHEAQIEQIAEHYGLSTAAQSDLTNIDFYREGSIKNELDDLNGNYIVSPDQAIFALHKDHVTEAKKIHTFEMLEKSLEMGWMPSQEDTALDWNTQNVFNADVAKRYPLVFKTFYENHCISSWTGFSQQFAGVYEMIHGEKYAGPVTLAELKEMGHVASGEVIPNPEAVQQVISLYRNTVDQQERMEILQNFEFLDRPIIPKSLLFPEDLASMGDPLQTPLLTEEYRPELITKALLERMLYDASHGDQASIDALTVIPQQIGTVLNTDFRQGVRIANDLDAIQKAMVETQSDTELPIRIGN